MAMIGMSGFVSAQVVVSSTAKSLADMGFSDDDVKRADSAHISVYSNNVRYWYDGTVPTASSGHAIVADAERILRGVRNLRNFKCIAESGSANIAITLGTMGMTS